MVPAIAEKAQALLDALAAGKYDAAGADFDEAMKKALPADKLEATWKALNRQLGAFKKPGAARVTKEGKYGVVTIPCEFEKMKLHPIVGAEILEQVNFPYPVVSIVRAHQHSAGAKKVMQQPKR